MCLAQWSSTGICQRTAESAGPANAMLPITLFSMISLVVGQCWSGGRLYRIDDGMMVDFSG